VNDKTADQMADDIFRAVKAYIDKRLQEDAVPLNARPCNWRRALRSLRRASPQWKRSSSDRAPTFDFALQLQSSSMTAAAFTCTRS